MAKVYRYELPQRYNIISGNYEPTNSANEDKRPYTGPYNCSVENNKTCYILDRMRNKHRDQTKYPGMYNDFDNYNDSHYCCCSTLKDLKKWFRGFNTHLIKHGFKIIEYTVNESILGKSGKQSIFNYKDITKRKVLTK